MSNIPPGRIRCLECGGVGYQSIEEDGVVNPLGHPCFSCETKGHVSPGAFRLDRIDRMTHSLALDLLNKRNKEQDEREDGEGVAFQASEAGMSITEFNDANFVIIWEKVASCFRWVEWNHADVTDALLERLVPLPVEEKIAESPKPDIIPPSSDDIPF